MSRSNAEEWAKRVARWRDSGLTAKEFAAETGLKASTLSYWSWKLRSGGEGPPSKQHRSRRASGGQPTATESEVAAQFVELPTASVLSTSAMLELIVGEFRVRVPAGVDEDTLGRVLRAVEAHR